MSRIICGLPGPTGAWKRAGEYTKIPNVVEINPIRPYDVIASIKPCDLVFVDDRLAKQFAMSGDNVFVVNPLPSADVPPGSPIGEYRHQYQCDFAIVNTPSEYAKSALRELSNNQAHFKVFGHYDYPIPEYVGIVDPSELPSVYSSAREVLDLVGNVFNVLAIGAAGGTCLSVANFSYPEIEFLNPTQNVYLAPFRYSHEFAQSITQKHTFAHRLQELVKNANKRVN